RMLIWGSTRQRTAAARVLITLEHDAPNLKKALTILAKAGDTAVAKLEARGERIEGWAAWQGDRSVSVSTAAEQDSTEIALVSDPRHPLTDKAWVASQFSMPMLPSH